MNSVGHLFSGLRVAKTVNRERSGDSDNMAFNKSITVQTIKKSETVMMFDV